MNKFEKKNTFVFTFNIFLLILIGILLAFLIHVHIDSLHVKIFSYFLLCLILVFITFLVAQHFLQPMFRTKRILELLIKDTLHELNIPLSVIGANLQMLKRGELDPKRIKRFHRINLACEDLKRLYQDLDYYIKREVMYDLVEDFDLLSFIELEVQKQDFQNFVLHIDEEIILHVDKRGFSKVIGNLLSNAIKYNKDNNDIIIEFKDNRLSIQDNGIGMSETQVFQVFDRYYQANKSNAGYGIGLSIVKAFCDEQKIYLNISSKLGVGTTITLDLKNILETK